MTAASHKAFVEWYRAYMANYGSSSLATGEALAEQAWKAALNFAEQTLGIDAETPEKLKELKEKIRAMKDDKIRLGLNLPWFEHELVKKNSGTPRPPRRTRTPARGALLFRIEKLK